MTTELSKFSLIYPDDKSQSDNYTGKDRPNIDMFVLDELGLSEIFELKNSNLDEYFTCSPEVIRHRMDLFEDMLAYPEIATVLNKLIPILTDIIELRRLEADSGNTESYLESITEIELYISCIATLNDGLAHLSGQLKSAALNTLVSRITELAGSEYYA